MTRPHTTSPEAMKAATEFCERRGLHCVTSMAVMLDAFAEAAIKRLRDDPAEQTKEWIAELNEAAEAARKDEREFFTSEVKELRKRLDDMSKVNDRQRQQILQGAK